MIDTLGWPTLAERRLKTRLIMIYKIAHALIAIPNNILIPTDSRTSLVLDMPEILLQGLIFVNFFLSIREIYFHLN
jgi:hypothetical protein